jgi:hypothetical protein
LYLMLVPVYFFLKINAQVLSLYPFGMSTISQVSR